MFVERSTNVDGKVIIQERTIDKSSTIKTKQQLYVVGQMDSTCHITSYGKISIKLESGIHV